MISVSVKANVDAMTRRLARLRDVKAPVSRALNKTATTVRATAARAIQDAGYNIKIGEIKRGLVVVPASRTRLAADIRAVGRPIPLIRYSANAVRAHGGGVSVNVLRGRKLIRGAFIATMPSGHRGVFVRFGSAAHAAYAATRGPRGPIRSAKHGLPIIELFGPGVPKAFVRQVVQSALVASTRDRFPVVLRQELNFERVRA